MKRETRADRKVSAGPYAGHVVEYRPRYMTDPSPWLAKNQVRYRDQETTEIKESS